MELRIQFEIISKCELCCFVNYLLDNNNDHYCYKSKCVLQSCFFRCIILNPFTACLIFIHFLCWRGKNSTICRFKIKSYSFIDLCIIIVRNESCSNRTWNELIPRVVLYMIGSDFQEKLQKLSTCLTRWLSPGVCSTLTTGHAVPDNRARGPVRRLRQEDCGPLLPAGRGQAVAHALPQVLRVQTQPGVGAHLLQQGRQHLLQGRLL